MDTARLRDIGTYRMGCDLAGRLEDAAKHQAQQADAIAWAADEIDRLTTLVAELQASRPQNVA